MSEEHELLDLLDDHKQEMPDKLYVSLCDKLLERSKLNGKEVIIVAVAAECLSTPYFSDDEQCVAQNVKQRILKVKCSPILESEMRLFCRMSAIEIIERSKYRESWFREYREGEYRPIDSRRYPLVLSSNNSDTGSVVVVSMTPCKRERK